MFKIVRQRIILFHLFFFTITFSFFTISNPWRQFSFFPWVDPDSYIYTDQVEGGTSELLGSKTNEESLLIEYNIKEDYILPYGAIGFIVEDSTFQKQFDTLTFNIKSRNVENYWVLLVVSSPHFPDNTVYYQQEFIADEELQEYSVLLEDFQTPYWWLERMGSRDQPVPFNRKTDSIMEIQLLAIQPHPGTNSSLIMLKDLTFQNSRSTKFLHILLYLSLITAVLFVLYFPVIAKQIRRVIRQDIFLPYVPLEKNYRSDLWSSDLHPYILKRYRNSEFNRIMVCDRFNLTEKHFKKIIREKTSFSFPQYINRLRISEAQKMLKETDLTVLEIALEAGYNSISNFNAQFKNIVKKTPGEFRKEWYEK